MTGFLPKDREVPLAGVYENGVLLVLTRDDAEGFLDSWEWLTGPGATCMMTTGFGDVFYWSAGLVHWLNVQRGTTVPVDPDLGWVIDEYLQKELIVDKVLRRGVLSDLVKWNRPLRYHEAFILEPWLILGGEDRLGNYNIVHCGVYVDLVGQTWVQLRNQEIVE